MSPEYALPYWPPDLARYNMEAVVFLSSGWLKTAFVLLALFWVAFRAYKVLSKPVEELVDLLGLEVPVAPQVSLAGIKADGILLHWKPPDQRASVVKYVIRINGIDIGDVAPQETSVTIENLQPDHHFTVRIVTLNTANFQAPSTPIRFKTLPAESDMFYSTAPHKENRDGQDADYTPTPMIRTNKNLVDVMAPSITAPILTREHSNSISRTRRSEPGRRNSPASQTADQARSAQEAAASMESIKVLTEKLDSLRRDLDDLDRQMQDEDEEFVTQKAILAEKRDEKKAALKEKDEISRDLRKEVATLERTNAAAQTRKALQEKLLRQKEADRKKVKDDVARWVYEAGELRTATEQIKNNRIEYEEASRLQIQELTERYAEEIQINKSLEEVVREKGIQIKDLEENRKQLEEGEEGGDALDGAENAEAEEDRRWVERFSILQRQYTEAWKIFNDAEHINQEASAQLQLMQQRRMSQPQLMSVAAPEFVPARRNSQRSRPLSMREPLLSAAPAGFIHSSTAPFNSGLTTTSPQYATITPYFNPVNGMALPPLSARGLSFSQTDLESLTGGAPMSPTAGALLPSGLFGDDSGLTDLEDNDDLDPGLSSLDPSPHLRHILPGLGAPGTLEQIQSPSSPVSIQSRSPFASPRDSVGQLGHYPSNEYAADSDRRSIRSTSSSFKNPPTTRFGGLFGLNRQRGKTLSDQGPPLGTLKPTQSQSLPRQDHGDLDPTGMHRRRGSHSSGAWYNAFMPTRTNTQPAESSDGPNHVATRKRAFNMFGARANPWLTSSSGLDRPSSPRQGSTNSAEASILPRPSTESQTRFGWSLDAFNARSSPLGVDWSVNNTNTSPWSRMPSRRPSQQHGSTASLLNEDLLHGDLPDFPSTSRSPTQAPIGTRPQSSASFMPPSGQVPPTPPKQLNPTAPQFQSIFTRADKAEKAKKAAERAAEKEARKAEKEAKKEAKADKSSRKDKERSLASDVSYDEANSSMDRRRSRDNRSITTAEYSDASPRESLERTASQTGSESQPPASFSKESFMQKLSRKSSSTQFLQFGKGKSFLLPKKSSEAVTPDEVDEDHGKLMLRDTDSPGQSPSIGTPKDKSSALSWSSIKRMGKRGDKTPSLHESIASETTGDEDEIFGEGMGIKGL